ncbi:4-aminobutyrate aminotransferase apoenzyme [Desulfocicer vacuolatum DSM 3385]|uniref:4-aminobutyrate aminotransferase apoenzyme n=1 Tax=Desulfocicer vacuolatum DSM 3385 TaxID=1121400 RepID=A0A1W2CXM0_9BACT|nr:4-aminobutyrate--2-oxoglutarate transaminase [Desulfocicer vacuolatum]SMC89973.1 4-aminobutyrate aminotransferase apoenzyme [Desulfocicer vacuolatum DSM 3385]
MNTNKEIQDLRAKVIPNGHASGTACYVESAKGATFTDVEGNEYIDFAGGIAVMNVGHSHPKVVEAIKAQAEKFTHTCFMVNPYDSAVLLADKLCKATPGDFPKKALFINSGAEAVENAVKIARYYTGRPAIVVFENAYHGRTALTMTMTAKVKPYKWKFGPFAPEIYRAPFGDIEALKEFFITGIDPESVAAIVAEPIQGEGGFIAPPDGYFQEVAALCKEHGILFVADEIQSGMGRTGKMFAMEHWGVEPDLTTVAKSIAAGMPLSAVVGKTEIMDSVHPGGLGGTYGANPVACAAGLAVMEIMEEENLVEKAEELGKTLMERFGKWQSEFAHVGEVRGIGAMSGITLVDEKGNPSADAAKELVGFCFKKGLSILACGIHGNVIRVLMPIVITDEQLEKGLSIMEEGLAALA